MEEDKELWDNITFTVEPKKTVTTQLVEENDKPDLGKLVL